MPAPAHTTLADTLDTRPVALVTGAAKRLGACIAQALVQANYRVAIHYHQSYADALETAQNCNLAQGQCALFQADLSLSQQVTQLPQKIIDHFGQLDVVINNASLFLHDQSCNFEATQLNTHMQINVAAPILLTRALYDHIQKRIQKVPNLTQATVINLLDQKLWNLNPDFLSYSLSKAALQTATSMLAQELAPHVRVCAIAPGLTYPSYLQSPQDFKRASVHSLSGSSVSPKDIAQTVLFLLNTPSINGSAVLVDAGQHLTAMPRDVSFL